MAELIAELILFLISLLKDSVNVFSFLVNSFFPSLSEPSLSVIFASISPSPSIVNSYDLPFPESQIMPELSLIVLANAGKEVAKSAVTNAIFLNAPSEASFVILAKLSV
ncbi:hypothetical protein RYD26_05355 [Pasteurellaceae bacterium LIM206]|nr:hypothetical protein [Pasteurellaceae bacterium LIM206]